MTKAGIKVKISMETYALREKLGDEKAIELIAQAGFDCIDYSFYWRSDDSNLMGGDDRAYARRIRQVLDDCGVTCNQAHAPFRMNYNEPFHSSNPHFAEIVRSVEAAAIMGARQIIVHALPIPLDENQADFEPINLRFYHELEPLCREFGIWIAVENLFQYDPRRRSFRGVLGTPQELCSLIEKLDSPCFTACIDVGHAALTGTEPEDFIRGMKPGMLQALHIQDTDYLDDRHALPFTGDLKWNSIMSALKDTDYQGELTLEIFHYLKRIPEKLLPQTLRYAADVARYLTSLFM